jgi:prealbumin domain-containing protein
MGAPQRWARAVVVPLLLLAFLALPGNAAQAPRGTFGTAPAQCANRLNGPSNPVNDCTGSAWINGNLNSNKSLYREGDFVPFRTPITGVVAGRTYSIRIGYDAVESGKHAYDYLGSFDASAAPGQQIIPCDGQPPTAGPHACGTGNPSTLAVPIDTATTFPPGASQAPGNFSLWGGTLQGAAYVNPAPIGVNPPDKVTRSIDVTFTAAGSTVVLAWGGHLASLLDWGTGNTFVGAGSGSPFHMRLEQIQESGQSPETIGGQELSIQAAALAPLPTPFTTQVGSTSITTEQTVVDTATLGGVSGRGPVTGQVQFFICGPAASAAAANCLQNGTRVGGPQVVVLDPPPNGPGGKASITFPQPGEGPIEPGNYCFRAEYTPSAVAQYSPAVHPTAFTTTECFVATLPPPRLTVTKLCVPANDPGHFNLLVNGAPLGGAAGTNVPCGGTTGAVQVAPGSHTVSESAGTGTSLGNYTSTIDGDCAANGSITLALGDTATCTITNVRNAAPPPAMLTVHKVCNPADDPGQFEIHIDGPNVNALNIATVGCGDSVGPVQLASGTYTVSEAGVPPTSLADYTTVISGACAANGAITLAPGQSAACTFTNTRIPPTTTLTVRKVCFPAGDGGHFRVGIFTISGRPVHRVVLTCHGTTGAVRVPPGTYVVRERGADGTDLNDYNRFVGGDCLSNGTVTLQAGDHGRCRIVNVRKRPKPQPAELTVIKICVPADDGGRFNLTVDGQTEADVACGHSSGPVAVPPGQHHVSESAGTGTSLSDYTTTIGGACAPDGTVTLAAGQQAACTITNVRTGTSPPQPPRETGTVEIEKQCKPARTQRRFLLELDEHIFHLACGQSTGPVVIPVGEHRVGEVAVNGITSRFRTTISGDCAASGSFTLSAGEHITCVVTNTRVRPPPVPKPPPACYRLSVVRRMVRVGGRVPIVAHVRLHRRPIQGVQVFAQGPGVFAVRTTGPRGRALFLLRLRRAGILRLTIRRPFACPKPTPKKIGVLGASQTFLTG